MAGNPVDLPQTSWLSGSLFLNAAALLVAKGDQLIEDRRKKLLAAGDQEKKPHEPHAMAIALYDALVK